jgi:hypothetical protein
MVGVLYDSHHSGWNSRLVLPLVPFARDLYRYRDVILDVLIALSVSAKMKSLRLLSAEATLAGWVIFLPLDQRALSRRTILAG